MTASPDTIEPYLLTMREWQCACLYVEGHTQAEMARRLKCSPGLIASMLDRDGVRAHIATAGREAADRARVTVDHLYSRAATIANSPTATPGEQIAALRLLGRWMGMEIERHEIAVHSDPVAVLERARKRALAAEQQPRQDTDQARQPINGHNGALN